MPLQRLRRIGDELVPFYGGGLVVPVHDPFVMDQTRPTIDYVSPRYPFDDQFDGIRTITSDLTLRRTIINGRVVLPSNASGTVILEDCLVDARDVQISSPRPAIEQHVNSGAELILKNVEIIGKTGIIGIGYRRFTAINVHIHHVEDAIRLHNSGGVGQALNVEVAGSLLGPLILETPDPYITRTDQKTHPDVVQIEGGQGAYLHGNAMLAYHTTDGTSNVDWVRDTPTPQIPVAPGTPNSRPHPQALSGVILTPNVSPITDFAIDYNWIEGGEMGFHAASSSNSTSTGHANHNRFDKGQWLAGWAMGIHSSATGITQLGNTYIEDGSTVVPKVSNS